MTNSGPLQGDRADAGDMGFKKVVASRGNGPGGCKGGGSGIIRGGGERKRWRAKRRYYLGTKTCNNVAYKLSLMERV